MLSGYFPKITLPSGKSDVRKGDGLALIIDGKVMLLDAFEGGEPTNRLINWLMEHIEPNENGTYVIDLLVISHIHGDHYGGGSQIANDSRFWIRKILCYNQDSLAFRVDSTANGKALKKDIASFKAFLNNVRAKKTAVEYIDKGSVFQFANTTWKVWRKQPKDWTRNDGGEAWAFVNDGSLALHCVETGLTYGGDGCDAIKEAIAQDGWKVSAVSVTHHGNSYEKSAAAATKSSGCMVAWQSCIERKGPGSTGWTTYGTQRLQQQGVPVWQQDADIFIEADGGQITVRQGSKSLTKEVDYHGWIHDSKGWKCGSYKDGAYQIGGKWYYFDSDGYTITGFYKPDNCNRYLHPDYKGAMQIGWFQAAGRQWYYADGYGRILTGWQEVDGKWYYLDPDKNGQMLKDEIIPDWNGLHYVDGWGVMQKNRIVEHEGKQYYADGWGVIQTGWIYTGGKWYCADDTGAFRVGWYEDPDLGMRYLEPTMVINATRTIDGKLYRFDGYGRLLEAKGKYPRADIVSLAQSFVGTAEGGTIHHRIIDQYNAHRPLPRGYKVTYTDAWCATFCSYLAIACGYTDIIPVECGCPQWITIAKSKGCWTESDTYAPRPGDFVLYDWQDSGSGDNTGTPDHIGIVEKVDGSTITVIEGNYNDSVKRRQIQIGGKYIRGYVTPKYSD